MDDKKVRLIEKAICGKWHLIAYGLGVSKGSKNCPLCRIYRKYDCAGCPIMLKDAKYYECQNTPCRLVTTETLLSASVPDMIDAAVRQIDFLCSLLPKGHKWYKEWID